MPALDQLLASRPYRTAADVDGALLRAAVREAIVHHCANCAPFDRWYRKQGADPNAEIQNLADVPFLPVSIFKRLELTSVGEQDIVRVLRSSATSSQTPSRVVLDKTTRDRQMRTLGSLLGALFEGKRRPFLVLDAAATPSANVELSARVAGMRGYLMMASETHYVLTADAVQPTLDRDAMAALLQRLTAQNTPVCVIGYTYMLYQYVVGPLFRAGIRFQLPPGSLLLHFGGWKRLQNQAVGRERLNSEAAAVFGVGERSIRDVYGFTEQLGVIYPDDGNGVRMTPAYADVIVRDPQTLEPVPDGTPGLLEFVTPLPHSYPGIALLLDDMGRIVSRDTPDGDRIGTRFEVLGRAEGSEIKGCGDTLPERVYAVRA